jgi:Tfp pilus assembly major pilin PilA
MTRWVLIAALLLCGAAQATTYYVDPSGGNDGNAGTSFAAAWATTQHAADTAVAGDVVRLCQTATETTAADGTATGVTTQKYTGKVRMLQTVPGAGGDAPTDNYDGVITDADGMDVLAGAGANRSTSATQVVADASLGAVVNSVLTLDISAAGDTNKGTWQIVVEGT